MGIIKTRHFFLFDARCKGGLMPGNDPWRLSENGYFPQSLRQAHPAAAGLKILNVFLRLKSSPSLTLQKISHSRTSSQKKSKISCLHRRKQGSVRMGNKLGRTEKIHKFLVYVELEICNLISYLKELVFGISLKERHACSIKGSIS